jgi:hypothetical protein
MPEQEKKILLLYVDVGLTWTITLLIHKSSIYELTIATSYNIIQNIILTPTYTFYILPSRLKAISLDPGMLLHKIERLKKQQNSKESYTHWEGKNSH